MSHPIAKHVGYVVVCPHCNNENEIYESDLGDEEFACQYSHCLNDFEIPGHLPKLSSLSQQMMNECVRHARADKELIIIPKNSLEEIVETVLQSHRPLTVPQQLNGIIQGIRMHQCRSN